MSSGADPAGKVPLGMPGGDIVIPSDESAAVVRAIAKGQVDAFVVSPGEQPQVITLASAESGYRLLADKVAQGAVTVAADTTILYANVAFARLVDMPPDTLPGSLLSHLVDGDDRPLLRGLMTAQTEAAAEGELTFVCGGRRFPARVEIHRTILDGDVSCIVVTDLTESRWHQSVAAAEALGRSILDQAVDAIVVCNARGEVIRASRSAFALCGGNPLRQPFARCFPLHAVNGALDVGAVLSGQAVRNAEFTMLVGGTAAHLLVSAGPVVDAAGQITACVVTLSDITPLKRTEAELKEADARKDDMLATVVHELRNPLSSITVVQHMLGRQPSDDPDVRRAREILERQVKHLVRLVEDLSDFSSIRLGKLDIERSRVDLRKLVEQVSEAHRPLIEARRQGFEVSLPPCSVTVHADAGRLHQVLGNLLTNAEKFTDEGGTIALSLAVSASADEAVVVVRDDGAGIRADVLPTIFDAFTQGAERRGGLGIGLALARRIVDAHGGTIEASSEGSGRGSVFSMRLPLHGTSAGP